MPQLKTAESNLLVATETAAGTRLHAIDILRALTMVFMIFVNDLWSLRNIPGWLEHVDRDTDGLGFADTIFPAFLFIVGLSLPYAIDARRAKGDSTRQLIGHILMRTAALLIMGVFLVNGEYLNEEATGIKRVVWYALSCIAFILIWNIYSRSANKTFPLASKVVGLFILLTLAFIYKGGEAGTLNRFSTYWWGILGLIGWSYLVAALVTVFSKNKIYLPLVAWLFFSILSMAASADLVPNSGILRFIPSAIRGGTLIAFTLGGVLTSFIFQYYRNKPQKQMFILYIVLAFVLIGLGLYTRTFWGISKLRSTPAWLFLCSSFTLLAFLFTYWLTDLKKKANWFNFIKPAGTDTLLCYLIPYFAYAITTLANIHLPEVLLTGYMGLLKSFLFALGCVGVTGILNQIGIRLKL